MDEVLRELASARQLVLDDVGAIVMAHPFSAVPLRFSVMGASTRWWGGYVMDLPTLWRFASDWYTGRLDRGYTRREPSAAADYLRSVGLAGPFWGLE